jgi:hypothetical protein
MLTDGGKVAKRSRLPDPVPNEGWQMRKVRLRRRLLTTALVAMCGLGLAAGACMAGESPRAGQPWKDTGWGAPQAAGPPSGAPRTDTGWGAPPSGIPTVIEHSA